MQYKYNYHIKKNRIQIKQFGLHRTMKHRNGGKIREDLSREKHRKNALNL